MSVIKQLLYCLALTFFCTAYVHAEEYRFSHVTSEQGLPHRQVEALEQDSNGFIWIGTRGGLAKYNGYGMRCYYHVDGDSSTLISDHVHSLFSDSRGRLWVGMDNGICRFCPETDSFKRYFADMGSVWNILETCDGRVLVGGSGSLLAYNESSDNFDTIPTMEGVKGMAIAPNGTVWVSSSHYITKYDASLTRFDIVDSSYYADFMTGADGIIPLFIDSREQLWIGRNGKGIMTVDLTTGEKKIIDTDKVSPGAIRSITEDQSHRIWLGSEHGITVISPNGHIDLLIHDLYNAHSISDNAVYDILCDKEGNIWVGSYFGAVDIMLRTEQPFICYEPSNEKGKLGGSVVRMMADDDMGRTWIATEDNGIFLFDKENDSFEPFMEISSLETNIHSLCFDKDSGDMWIGTFLNGLFRYNVHTHAISHYLHNHGLKSDAIFYMVFDSEGTLWLATTQGLQKYEKRNDQFVTIDDDILSTCFIYSLCVGQKNIWAGTVEHGLFRIDPMSGNVTRICGEGTPLHGDEYVTCLHLDKKQRLWIGTDNDGLFCDYGDSIVTIAKENILSGHYKICSICSDNDSNMWIGTTRGLLTYRPDSSTTSLFTMADGLIENQFNYSSAYATNDGRLLFGTVKGLALFTPESINTNSLPYHVQWESLRINNHVVTTSTPHTPLSRPIEESETLKLQWNQSRSFSIEYAVIRPGHNASIEYSVCVDGLDNEWHVDKGNRVFQANMLRPGTYVLRVRAGRIGEDYSSNPESALRITILPPVWRSPYAICLYVLLFLTSIFILSRLLHNHIKERNKVKVERMEYEKQEEINKAKLEFFSIVSHELKTPLALIEAPLKCMRRETLDQNQQKHLATALHGANKLEDLIEQLVTFNKLETNKFPFYIQRGNPLEFILMAVNPFREIAIEKDVSFVIDCEDNGEEVWFSPSYLERILGNLLSNAFKFTSSGGQVSVKANITVYENDPLTYMQVSVADTGIGIAPEELNNIFTLYYQTKRGYNLDNSGWGIGLSLVKRLVEIHKGTIQVESELGKGTIFTFLLCVSSDAFESNCLTTSDKVLTPLDEYQFSLLSRLADNNDASLSDKGNGPNLLIVEDHADLLAFLSQLLSVNYHVLTATNGAQALSVVQEEPVQLIISDVMMPEMNGYELCRLIKNNVETSHIPVILLTARTESDDVLTGYQSGAEAYVKKPFDPTILELQISNILRLQKARQQELVEAGFDNIDTSSLGQLDKEFMQQINRIVTDNLSNSDFSIGDITDSLSISRTLLHVKMKNLTGMSMGEYLHTRRIEEACRLLLEGYNVSETAYQTGFSDPNYFSKAFRKHKLMSPTEWLRQNKG